MRREQRESLSVPAAALALVAALFFLCPVQLFAQSPNPRSRLIWSKASPAPTGMAVTPDGRFSVVIDKTDKIRLYDTAGNVLWAKDAEGATSVAISASGNRLVTYTPLNPLRRKFTILNSDGKDRGSRNVSGCVWSVAISDDGSTVVIGAGDKRMSVFTVGKRSLRYRRRTLPGIPISMAFASAGSRLVIGMWQKSGIGLYDLRGRSIWRASGETDLLYSVTVSRSGMHILSHGRPNRPQPRDVIAFWRLDGKKLWQKRLKLNEVRADLSPDGNVVALSYRRQMIHGREQMSERWLALFDTKGNSIWDREKGGVFLRPQLIAAFSGGDTLVVCGKALYTIDRKGAVTTKLPLPAYVRQYAPARSAGRALVYCGDGKLYMYGRP